MRGGQVGRLGPRSPAPGRSARRFRSNAESRRIASIARNFAAAISQAPGLSGTPVRGHRSSAATSASWARSSASPTSRTILVRPAINRADSIRQTASIARLVAGSATCAYPWAPACSRSRSSCSRSSGVSWSPKSSASKTWRISISDSPSIGFGQRLTHSMASSMST